MAFVQDIYHIRYFLLKGKLVLRSLLSEVRYFRGDHYFGDLLRPIYTYFWRFATFEGSLLSELYGCTDEYLLKINWWTKQVCHRSIKSISIRPDFITDFCPFIDWLINTGFYRLTTPGFKREQKIHYLWRLGIVIRHY